MNNGYCENCGADEVRVEAMRHPGAERQLATCTVCNATGVKVTTYSGPLYGY